MAGAVVLQAETKLDIVMAPPMTIRFHVFHLGVWNRKHRVVELGFHPEMEVL